MNEKLLVKDVEVVTVTDTSAIITWFSGSATEVDRYGFPEPLPGDTEHSAARHGAHGLPLRRGHRAGAGPDLHVRGALRGQDGGIADDDYPPAFQQDQGLPPYPEVMLGAVLDDLGKPDRGADQLLVAGDLTAEAAPGDVARVRELLDRFGQLGNDYFVTQAGFAGQPGRNPRCRS